jgi:benzoyl-CoA reductase subunit B
VPPPASEKQLESTRASSEHQKAWFAGLRRDVFDEKKPYAIAQADMPLELFQLLGVPVVSNQWWSAVVSAKQLSGYFFDALGAAGYHEGLCRYSRRPAARSRQPHRQHERAAP